MANKPKPLPIPTKRSPQQPGRDFSGTELARMLAMGPIAAAMLRPASTPMPRPRPNKRGRR
jgi:hypothetical protein